MNEPQAYAVPVLPLLWKGVLAVGAALSAGAMTASGFVLRRHLEHGEDIARLQTADDALARELLEQRTSTTEAIKRIDGNVALLTAHLLGETHEHRRSEDPV